MAQKIVGEQIKHRREEKGISQSDLAKLVNTQPSTLSRIEKGEVGQPSQKLLLKLAEILEVDIDTFYLPAGAIPITTTLGKLKIGFGHCLWAAPVIKTLMESGGVKDILFTSFGIRQKNAGGKANIKPFWYDRDNYLNGEKIHLPPNIKSLKNESDNFSIDTLKLHSKDDEDYTLYTADTLIDLLKSDSLDGVLVPSEIYNNNTAILDQIAQITNTLKGACYLTMVVKDNVFDAADGKISLTEISSTLEEYNIKNAKFYYPKKTVGENFVQIFQQYIKSTKRDTFHFSPTDLENPGTLHKLIESEMQNLNIFFLLSWEPQVSWIEKIVKELNDDKKWEVIKAATNDIKGMKRIDYLSFDLLYKKSTLKSLYDRGNLYKLTNLCDELESSAKTLSVNTMIDYTNNLISNYLDMEQEHTKQQIAEINFKFMYYPEWLRTIGNLKK